jgi:hypothetical protein
MASHSPHNLGKSRTDCPWCNEVQTGVQAASVALRAVQGLFTTVLPAGNLP